MRRFKQFVFILLVPLLVAGYFFYHHLSTEKEKRQTELYAQVTAHLWLAAAHFRNNPQQLGKYRDSLLKAHNLSPKKIEAYLHRNRKRPERYDKFADLVKKYVDSLAQEALAASAADSTGDTVHPP